ncbi:GNAT family N-acetyltransferase [Candidatus Woesearchaeota archaeon]|nr:GNAT family N-acetyltransferase [Candidatus Woesearchaeota archaeon]
MVIEIKEGSLNQLQDIVRLNHKIFSGMYENEPYSFEHYKQKLEGKDVVIFVATNCRQIVADSIAYKKDNTIYVWILGVSSDCRGKGIGTRLLEMTEEYARKQRLKQVTTKVYNVSPAMQHILLKRGYRVERTDISDNTTKYDAKHFLLEL